jgi:hypothetical protein
MKPPRVLPKRTVCREIGAEINLSKVFTLLSVGITPGPIEDELNRMVIAVNPEMSDAGVRLLPTAKERNRKRGNINPNINTGDLM